MLLLPVRFYIIQIFLLTGDLLFPKWANISILDESEDFRRPLVESSLMTTCVSSFDELKDLIDEIGSPLPICLNALRALFYFMRCSHLEASEQKRNISQVIYND